MLASRIQPEDVFNLLNLFAQVKIVILVDDMRSMTQPSHNLGPENTYWDEARQIVTRLVELLREINPAIASAVNPPLADSRYFRRLRGASRGVDVWFLSRPGLSNVLSSADVQRLFASPPHPADTFGLIRSLCIVFSAYQKLWAEGHRVLVLTVRGQSCGDHSYRPPPTMFPPNCHVTFINLFPQGYRYFYGSFHISRDISSSMPSYRESLDWFHRYHPSLEYDYTTYLIACIYTTFYREHPYIPKYSMDYRRPIEMDERGQKKLVPRNPVDLIPRILDIEGGKFDWLFSQILNPDLRISNPVADPPHRRILPAVRAPSTKQRKADGCIIY